MSQQTAPPPPDTIGPYTLDCLLGTGGMGEVYKAFDPRLDRWVAVKHIKAEFALKAGYRQRLEREAKTIASLDHPSIVQIYDVLRDDDGGEWIVMEMVDGPTVYEMLDAGPLDLGTTLTIALDVIHGLGVAHDQGVLHRDLKSENVMVSRKGVAKILDFGLSKRLEQVDEATLSMEGKVIGTCRVMAPEQADGQDLDGRADLFSFGILLYEMVTARSPFRASTPMASMLKAFGEPHAPVHSYNPDVPQELSDLIDWLLSKNRNHRPENALVVAAELTELAGDLTDNPAELAERIRMASRSWHGSGAYGLPAPSEAETEDDPLDETVPGGPSEPYGESSRATSSRRRTASLSRSAASRAVEETMERSRIDLDRRSADASSPSRWSSMFSTAFGLSLSPPRRALAWTAWLMAILTGWWGVASVTRPMVVEEPEDARIMVMPFENHGPDEMDYFASGLTSELIRELTSRRGLAVVSYRTSSFYRSEDRPLRDIGEELDVSYVIEGSVLSEAAVAESSSLRISLRLIRLEDGQVMMSNSVNRSLTDVLRAQSEIADDVALELGAQILADSHRDSGGNPLALEAYYRGISLLYGSGYSFTRAPEADRLLALAVERDPEFVRAWTELARVRCLLYFNNHEARHSREQIALAVERAKELSPEAPSVILADGYYKYYVLRDYSSALSAFRRAAEKAPSDPASLEAIGFVLRRLGHLDEAVQSLEKAFDLDRANRVLAGAIAESERARRAYGRAEDWFSVALRVSSDSARILGERSENALARLGCGELSDQPACAVEEARGLLADSDIADSPELWAYQVNLAWLSWRTPAEAEAFLKLYDSAGKPGLYSQRFRFWMKVLTLRELGREVEARSFSEAIRRELEVVTDENSSWINHAPLAVALALLGETAEAAHQISLALEDASKDPFSGPRALEWAAMAAVLSGDEDAAVQHLMACSKLSYQRSLASYEILADRIWEPLRAAGALDPVLAELKRQEQ